ncbi:MAG TPA: PilZ domain-containing protein [Acidimicrobiales bacterium]|nr:PilZ domain-containing protein [Acidimicrobiales bacterium]
MALIELSTGGNECLTGVVLDGDDDESVLVDLGASPRPPASRCEVVASFFAPDALYRMKATLTAHNGLSAIIDLTIHDIERVQRRLAPRARITLPVVLSNFDDPGSDESGAFRSVVGETLDLGEGGCRVLVGKPFPVGGDPTVTISLPGDGTVVALAAVLQAQAAPGGYEYRLVFLEMDEVDRLKLAELVSEPAPA